MNSKRLLSAFSVFCAALPVANGQLPPPPTGGDVDGEGQPRIVAKQRSHDLGKIVEGDTIPVSWIIENEGTADLIIERTKVSCGCTLVGRLRDSEKVIPPGESLTIKAEFNSKRRRGKQSKFVTVFSNDPAEPRFKLEFTAEVVYLFEIKPPGVLNLNAVRRGVPAKKVLEISPGVGRHRVEILKVDLEDKELISYEFEPVENGIRLGQRVTFTVSEDAAMGPIKTSATLYVKVDGIERKRVVPIRGEIVGDLICHPKVVKMLDQGVLPGKRLAPVTLRSSDTTSFDVLSCDAGALFDLEISHVRGKPDRTQYIVYLQVRDDAPPGPFGALLTMRTSSLDQPVVQVPIFGTVADVIRVEPPVILLRADDTPKGRERRVRLRASPRDTLEVTSITSDSSAISAEIDLESSGRYRHLVFLTVTLDGTLAPGVHETSLRVATTVPGAETLDIPVTIIVPG